jgi:peptidoglycan-associated lipoprotein
MKKTSLLVFRVLLPASMILLGACRKTQPQPPPLDPSVYGTGTDGELIEVMGPGGGVELPGRGGFETMVPVNSPYAPVYFGYDSSSVMSGEMSKVQEVARHLNANPRLAVILQGNTDERGSREYNLALGERRALAVREMMLSMGVEASRIQTLSYGEEQPAVSGFDESAWSMNRRVDFQLMQ